MPGLVALNLRPDTRALKQFGFVAIAGFGLLAWAAFREKAIFVSGLGSLRLPVTALLVCLGLFSGISSLIRPAANRPLYVGISLLSFPLGYVLSALVMAVLFFAVFGVVAIAMRLFGRDPMRRSREPKSPSYWITSRANRNGDGYFRQF